MEISRCSICGKYLGDYAVHSEYYKYFSVDEKMEGLLGFICNKCAIIHSGTKKLYHISFSCNTIERFNPRVPSNRHLKEDSYTDRICLSDSIEGCLTAVPNGGMCLEDIFWEGGSTLIRVYEFNIEDIDFKNIIPPEYLYQKDMVRDSAITREHWVVNQALLPSKTYLIKLHKYDEVYPDDISYEDYINGMMADEEGRRDFHWDEVINGNFTEIQNLQYEIIPEERRSQLFKINNEIINISEDDFNSIEIDIYDMFPDIMTWVKIESDSTGKLTIIGDIDTRGTGEYDVLDIIDYINSQLSIGEIIK